MKRYPPLEITAPLLFAFIFALTLIYSRLEPHVEDVDASYVREHTGKPGYVLVDVRPERIYEGESPRAGIPGGHIPGAISFPLKDLQTAAASAALAKVGVVKMNTVILYCNTGADSGRFADALIRGFRFSPARIKNYRGGIMDWIKDSKNKLLPEDHETVTYGSINGK